MFSKLIIKLSLFPDNVSKCDAPADTLGCPKKQKNLKAEKVPLSCGYIDQVEKKSLKDCIVLINM